MRSSSPVVARLLTALRGFVVVVVRLLEAAAAAADDDDDDDDDETVDAGILFVELPSDPASSPS